MPKSLAEAGVKAYLDVLELHAATVTTILLKQVYGVMAKTISLRLPMSSNQADIDYIFSAIVITEEDKKEIEEVSRAASKQQV